jgi:hypothetical protein
VLSLSHTHTHRDLERERERDLEREREAVKEENWEPPMTKRQQHDLDEW